ncbi:hypothetical protein JW948_15175 [bacterium]|nr:hypothetical protein [bacterium]
MAWQYKLIDSNAFKKPGLMKDFAPADVEAYLNKLGQQGWEIVSFDCRFKLKAVEFFYGLAKREAQGAPQEPAAEQAEVNPESP